MAPVNSPIPVVDVPEESFYTFILKNDTTFNETLPFVIEGASGEKLSRAELKARVITFASSLRNLEKAGLFPLTSDATVTVFSPNSLLYPVMMLASGAAGVVGAFANAAFTDQELAKAYQSSHSSHILVHPALLLTAVSALTSLGLVKEEIAKRIVVLAPKASLPAEVVAQGWVTLDDLKPLDGPFEPANFDGEKSKETALIFFSSGTTGPSKAAALSHRNINAILRQLSITWNGYGSSDTIIAVIPFFHVFGAIILLLFGYLKGVPVVTLPRFDPAQFLSCFAKYHITVAMLVPPLLNFLAKHPVVDKFDLSTLRILVVGAAPVAPSLFTEAFARFDAKGTPVTIVHAMGLTESSGSIAYLDIPKDGSKGSSVGPLLPGMEGRTVDDNGEDVPEGEPGELWLRGPNIMKGYLGDDEANNQAFTPDGWFKTGDVVLVDKDKHITVVDRSKELIKYKGFQVPPAELEALLTTHPGVADAGVIGVYSEADATELPKAFIVPKDASLVKEGKQEELVNDIHDWLKDRVAHYKLLRGGIVLVEAIPRSTAGKILRRHLKEKATTA